VVDRKKQPAAPEILTGTMPSQIDNADVILIDSHAVFYPMILETMTRKKLDLVTMRIHPHIDAILLSDRARKHFTSTPGTHQKVN
jgi:hypothetical protein